MSLDDVDYSAIDQQATKYTGFNTAFADHLTYQWDHLFGVSHAIVPIRLMRVVSFLRDHLGFSYESQQQFSWLLGKNEHFL